jgi:hypothetical protein
MIQLPRRSVTRFFIPLIDVLILLFCIFLLMPLLKGTGEGEDSAQAADSGKSPSVSRAGLDPKDKDGSKAETERLRKERDELERLRREKIDTLQQRLFIRVLEIDADSGKLYYAEAQERIEIRNQEDAVKLIAHHKEEAGARELYYLFLYPRRLTGFPQEKQVRQYESWFKGVAHGLDNPLAAR